jgi:hypothetical protein
MASTRWMISGRKFFGSNTVEFMLIICRPSEGKASHLLRDEYACTLKPAHALASNRRQKEE